MSIMVVNTSKMEVVKVCATAEQAYYWADLLCPSGYHIDDFGLSNFDVFSDTELREIYNHTLGKQCPQSMMTREIIIGSLLNIESNLTSTETVEQLHAMLKRAPNAPKIVPLSPTQQLSQCGNAANAGNGVPTAQRVTGGGSYAVKQPKEGSTTRRVWDQADELAKQFSDIKELRSHLIDWGNGQGINPSTVRTQFNHWRNFHKSDNT